jgi:hypothetical protein
MITIWKYKLEEEDLQTVVMPKEAKAISAQTQKEIPCIWALVDTEAPLVSRTVVIVPTGEPVTVDLSNYDFVGTIQLSNGHYIQHVFINKED